jgi:hypothetical protein
MWQFRKNEVTAPNVDGKSADLKFTFDHILDGDTTQEQMYRAAGSETIN